MPVQMQDSSSLGQPSSPTLHEYSLLSSVFEYKGSRGIPTNKLFGYEWH